MMRIRNNVRCPKCQWQPAVGMQWTCRGEDLEFCCRFDTFETQGVCPRCQSRWHQTQCPNCQEWSAHLAWYLDLDSWLDGIPHEETVLWESAISDPGSEEESQMIILESRMRPKTPEESLKETLELLRKHGMI